MPGKSGSPAGANVPKAANRKSVPKAKTMSKDAGLAGFLIPDTQNSQASQNSQMGETAAATAASSKEVPTGKTGKASSKAAAAKKAGVATPVMKSMKKGQAAGSKAASRTAGSKAASKASTSKAPQFAQPQLGGMQLRLGQFAQPQLEGMGVKEELSVGTPSGTGMNSIGNGMTPVVTSAGMHSLGPALVTPGSAASAATDVSERITTGKPKKQNIPELDYGDWCKVVKKRHKLYGMNAAMVVDKVRVEKKNAKGEVIANPVSGYSIFLPNEIAIRMNMPNVAKYKVEVVNKQDIEKTDPAPEIKAAVLACLEGEIDIPESDSDAESDGDGDILAEEDEAFRSDGEKEVRLKPTGYRVTPVRKPDDSTPARKAETPQRGMGSQKRSESFDEIFQLSHTGAADPREQGHGGEGKPSSKLPETSPDSSKIDQKDRKSVTPRTKKAEGAEGPGSTSKAKAQDRMVTPISISLDRQSWAERAKMASAPKSERARMASATGSSARSFHSPTPNSERRMREGAEWAQPRARLRNSCRKKSNSSPRSAVLEGIEERRLMSERRGSCITQRDLAWNREEVADAEEAKAQAGKEEDLLDAPLLPKLLQDLQQDDEIQVKKQEELNQAAQCSTPRKSTPAKIGEGENGLFGSAKEMQEREKSLQYMSGSVKRFAGLEKDGKISMSMSNLKKSLKNVEKNERMLQSGLRVPGSAQRGSSRSSAKRKTTPLRFDLDHKELDPVSATKRMLWIDDIDNNKLPLRESSDSKHLGKGNNKDNFGDIIDNDHEPPMKKPRKEKRYAGVFDDDDDDNDNIDMADIDQPHIDSPESVGNVNAQDLSKASKSLFESESVDTFSEMKHEEPFQKNSRDKIIESHQDSDQEKRETKDSLKEKVFPMEIDSLDEEQGGMTDSLNNEMNDKTVQMEIDWGSTHFTNRQIAPTQDIDPIENASVPIGGSDHAGVPAVGGSMLGDSVGIPADGTNYITFVRATAPTQSIDGDSPKEKNEEGLAAVFNEELGEPASLQRKTSQLTGRTRLFQDHLEDEKQGDKRLQYLEWIKSKSSSSRMPVEKPAVLAGQRDWEPWNLPGWKGPRYSLETGTWIGLGDGVTTGFGISYGPGIDEENWRRALLQENGGQDSDNDADMHNYYGKIPDSIDSIRDTGTNGAKTRPDEAQLGNISIVRNANISNLPIQDDANMRDPVQDDVVMERDNSYGSSCSSSLDVEIRSDISDSDVIAKLYQIRRAEKRAERLRELTEDSAPEKSVSEKLVAVPAKALPVPAQKKSVMPTQASDPKSDSKSVAPALHQPPAAQQPSLLERRFDRARHSADGSSSSSVLKSDLSSDQCVSIPQPVGTTQQSQPMPTVTCVISERTRTTPQKVNTSELLRKTSGSQPSQNKVMLNEPLVQTGNGRKTSNGLGSSSSGSSSASGSSVRIGATGIQGDLVLTDWKGPSTVSTKGVVSGSDGFVAGVVANNSLSKSRPGIRPVKNDPLANLMRAHAAQPPALKGVGSSSSNNNRKGQSNGASSSTVITSNGMKISSSTTVSGTTGFNGTKASSSMAASSTQPQMPAAFYALGQKMREQESGRQGWVPAVNDTGANVSNRLPTDTRAPTKGVINAAQLDKQQRKAATVAKVQEKIKRQAKPFSLAQIKKKLEPFPKCPFTCEVLCAMSKRVADTYNRMIAKIPPESRDLSQFGKYRKDQLLVDAQVQQDHLDWLVKMKQVAILGNMVFFGSNAG